MPVKVFISTSSFGEYDTEPLELLKRRGLEPVLNPLKRTLKPQEIIEYGNGCVGIIAGTEHYSREVLSGLPNLKVISRCGAGLDTIDLESAGQMGIAVTCTPYGPTEAVAELTVGFILNLLRFVESSSARVKRGLWEKRMGFLVRELKIGILGLGKIGKRVAELLRGFSANVSGCDINPDHTWAGVNGVSIIKERDDLLKGSDVLCLHLPYENTLHHLIGKRELALMKRGSYLINASRGGLIDEEALCVALRAARLNGAAIDTFEREPYDGPLRELDNVILTPHIGSYARSGRIKMERESVENLMAEVRRLKLGPGH